MVLDANTPNDWFTVALALLNVLQTVALAYLAASRRQETHPPNDRPAR